MIKRILHIIIFLVAFFESNSQTVRGFLSRKPSSTAEGCGCTGCNDAAYMASVNYPDPAGGCGTTEPSGNSGSCGHTSKTRVVVIPAGCTVTAVGYMGDRAGCTGGTHGPGMDATGPDQFSITGSLGTLNGATGLMTGTGNANVTSPVITQVGGQLTFFLRSDRVAELLTYTITYSAVGCTPSPLPLELLNFSADRDADEINLQWSTASEKNTESFDIEYSYDAINFEVQTSVKAAGNIYDINHYNKILPNTFGEQGVYFRLKLKDNDGSYTYSPIINIQNNYDDLYTLFPNPTTSGEISIQPSKKIQKNNVLQIINSTGLIVYNDILKYPEDKIDLKKFGKGLYFFYLINNEKTTIRKVIYN